MASAEAAPRVEYVFEFRFDPGSQGLANGHVLLRYHHDRILVTADRRIELNLIRAS